MCVRNTFVENVPAGTRLAKQLAATVITADKAMRDRGARAYQNTTFLGGIEGH